MAVEARQQLNTEVVDQLNQLFDPVLESSQEQIAFADLVSQINQSHQEFNLIRVRSEAAISPFQESVFAAGRIVEEAELVSKVKRADIYSPRSNTNLGVIIGRVRVALSDPNLILPTLLQPLKIFALDIHPDLTPFHHQLNQARVHRQSSQDELQIQTDKAKEEANQAKFVVEQNLHRASQDLIAFCDQRAAQSRSFALEYLVTLPERLPPVAETFVSKNALNEIELERFPEFTSFLRSNRVSEERIKRWLNGLDNNPSPEQIAQNQELQRRWKDFLRYSFLEDCYKSGITTKKPDIPISLLRS